ncbi:hypothetical protein [Lentzea sp. HUAS12]|uniref:hypothetical protein n=1 Tax=Lentzea sp. HUAS12 TaxID=2951806 RepID=UPI0020A10E50|nr:hypothetical protein [Lentzea sp. HUAS12]USX49076.1 hypothetical protein ND450_26940 [Lentzea sp. HUAS12]
MEPTVSPSELTAVALVVESTASPLRTVTLPSGLQRTAVVAMAGPVTTPATYLFAEAPVRLAEVAPAGSASA